MSVFTSQTTWDEFKAWVEKQLAEEGLDGSVVLRYIDFTYSPDGLYVHRDLSPLQISIY
jgi:hypothetical protein